MTENPSSELRMADKKKSVSKALFPQLAPVMPPKSAELPLNDGFGTPVRHTTSYTDLSFGSDSPVSTPPACSTPDFTKPYPIPYLRLAQTPPLESSDSSPHTPVSNQSLSQPPPSPTPTRPRHVSRSPLVHRQISNIREGSPSHNRIDDATMKDDLRPFQIQDLLKEDSSSNSEWDLSGQFHVLLQRTETPPALPIDNRPMSQTASVMKKRPHAQSRRELHYASDSVTSDHHHLKPPGFHQLENPPRFDDPNQQKEKWLDARYNPFSPWKPTPKESINSLMCVTNHSDFARLVSDFVQESKLGRGSFGEVVLARNRIDGWKYAVKKIPWTSTKQREWRIREVYALAAIGTHPNIIRYHCAWIEDKDRLLCIQTEYCAYGNLANWSRQKTWDEASLCDLLKQIASALHYMHAIKRFAHLDVKPENIFVTPTNSVNEEGGVTYKLGDLGLLLELDKPTVDDLEDIELGDGHYLPRDLLNSFGQKVPSEQLARADIYSLACSILEVASGKRPQGSKWGSIFNAIQSRYSPQFVELLSSMLHPDPFQRPTAEQLLQHPLLCGETENLKRQVADLQQQLKSAKEELLHLKTLLHRQQLANKNKPFKRRETFHVLPSAYRTTPAAKREQLIELLVKHGVPSAMQSIHCDPNALLQDILLWAQDSDDLSGKENIDRPASPQPTESSDDAMFVDDCASVQAGRQSNTPDILAFPPAQCQSLPASPLSHNPRSKSKRALKLKLTQ